MTSRSTRKSSGTRNSGRTRNSRAGAAVIGFLALAMIVAACVNPLDALDGDGIGDGANVGDQPPATLGSEPVGPGSAPAEVATDENGGVIITADFQDGRCNFAIPPGHEPRCGTVVVPMDWDTGEGHVRLPVAVFTSTADQPAPDPVVYLDGGPGSHALDTIEYVVEDFLDPLLTRGDVIFFDQRGAGQAIPRLSCDETEAIQRRLEDEPEVSDEESIELFHDALRRCRSRLISSGIDLTDYNSINNAADVEAIRVALGYERWNLFGISYGTKLGLEVMRRHPAGVRSAVLDSVYPPQVDSVLENPTTFLDSYNLVVAACRAERPGCGAEGDLDERIRAVVARYEANPVTVEIRDWIADESDTVTVTGQTIADTILGALYSTWQLTDIPELVTELEAGETAAIVAFLSQDRSTERFFSNGMFYAVACNEEISFADETAVAAAVPADPFGLGEFFDFASNTGNLAFGTCQAFENGQAPAASNTAVVSDVPTLLMAGRYDPVTPISWARRAAETLSNGHLVIGPHASHGVSGDQCGVSVALAFLNSPDVSPDGGCLDDAALSFLAPGDPSVALAPLNFRSDDFGVELTSVSPADWSFGSLQGDQYRRQSFLDPTEFYQLAADASLGFGLQGFLEAEKNLTLSPRRTFGGEVGPISADEINRTWQYRTGQQANRVFVDWFEAEINGQTTYVILVSSRDERNFLLETVVLPALQAIEVRGL